MATLAQVILIIACVYLVDGRFLRKLHIHLHDGHQAPVKTDDVRDDDAVIFPNDDDINQYTDDSKVEAVNVMIPANDKGTAKGNTKNVEDVVMPLISKIIPEVQVKDVFTNAISEKAEIGTDTLIDDTTTLNKKPSLVEHNAGKNEIVANENENTNNDGHATKVNDTVTKLNDIVPDFSSRFGGTGNYMLVPVAATVQNFQPIQAYPNTLPGTQTYLPNNNANSNGQLVPTPNVHYAVPNGTPNIGANMPANVASNFGPVQYPANNMHNVAQGNPNIYVNVPNTYVINGQLYAAVTVPSNGNVPNTLYYVNPQVTGYQVVNNLPLYKLASLDGGNQVLQNTQYAQKK